jgi:hypothetical protein
MIEEKYSTNMQDENKKKNSQYAHMVGSDDGASPRAHEDVVSIIHTIAH